MWILMYIAGLAFLFALSWIISSIEIALDPEFKAAKKEREILEKMIKDGTLFESVRENPEGWKRLQETPIFQVKSEEYKGTGTFDRKSVGELEIEAARNLNAYKTALQSVDKDAYDKIFGDKK